MATVEALAADCRMANTTTTSTLVFVSDQWLNLVSWCTLSGGKRYQSISVSRVINVEAYTARRWTLITHNDAPFRRRARVCEAFNAARRAERFTETVAEAADGSGTRDCEDGPTDCSAVPTDP